MAVKTEQQIERDFYSFVKNSALGKAIKGAVYRSEMRPNDAITEDLIIKFLAGLDEQIQTGVVILNIYVPDKPYKSDSRKVIDHKRVGELQELLNEFVNDNADTEYRIMADTTPTTMKVEGLEQHLIYSRIKFYRLTE